MTEELKQEQGNPVAYINVEQRKLEWAKPIVWETPTVANLPKIPLYTTPQPRKPLTFEQVEDCFGDGVIAEENGILISAQWLHDFARAIESAHGIKE